MSQLPIPGSGRLGGDEWFARERERLLRGDSPGAPNLIDGGQVRPVPAGPSIPGPGTPGTDGGQTPPPLTTGQITPDNAFDAVWPGAPSGFNTRDDWSIARNNFLQPLYGQFRAQGKEAEDDASLFNDPRFRTFAGGGGYVGGTGRAALPPNQFDDPYTTQLENITKSQMGEVRNNPGLETLMQFLKQQFGEYANAPGFSPEEMSLLNTQAFEPIEDFRKASHERSLQRTASRGFLPSSGLTELDARGIDRDADRMRTQAGRDLAVSAIDRRDADLNRALSLATTMGQTIPQGQRAEELNLSNLLYSLPRNALTDSLAVLNGSPSTAQLGTTAAQQAYQQQLERQQRAQEWQQIGTMLTGLFQ